MYRFLNHAVVVGSRISIRGFVATVRAVAPTTVDIEWEQNNEQLTIPRSAIEEVLRGPPPGGPEPFGCKLHAFDDPPNADCVDCKYMCRACGYFDRSVGRWFDSPLEEYCTCLSPQTTMLRSPSWRRR